MQNKVASRLSVSVSGFGVGSSPVHMSILMVMMHHIGARRGEAAAGTESNGSSCASEHMPPNGMFLVLPEGHPRHRWNRDEKLDPLGQ